MIEAIVIYTIDDCGEYQHYHKVVKFDELTDFVNKLLDDHGPRLSILYAAQVYRQIHFKAVEHVTRLEVDNAKTFGTRQ